MSNPNQSKANALLNSTNSQRHPLRNPYHVPAKQPPVAAKGTQIQHIKTQSNATASASNAFRRNARDDNSNNKAIPRTSTDLMLLGLLDGRRGSSSSNSNSNNKTKKKKLSSQDKHDKKRDDAKRDNDKNSNTNAGGHLKRRKINNEWSSNELSVAGGIPAPPPVRSYPVEKIRSAAKRRKQHGELLFVEKEMTARGLTTGRHFVDGVKNVKSSNNNLRRPSAMVASKMNEFKDVNATTIDKSDKKLLIGQPKAPLIDAQEPRKDLKVVNAAIDKSDSLIGQSKVPPSDAASHKIHLSKLEKVVTNNGNSITKPLLLGIGRKKKNARLVSNSSVQKTSFDKDGSAPGNIMSSSQDQDAAASSSDSLATSSTDVQDFSQSETEVTDISLLHDKQTNSLPTNNVPSANQQSHHAEIPPSPLNNTKEVKHASWYNPQEHAQLKAEASDNLRIQQEIKRYSKATKTSSSSSSGINDNYVKLDLRNSAGSCRGARNLKKVNKQKAWRAKYRFGKSDGPTNAGEDGETIGQEVKRGKTKVYNDNNEKYFIAKNGGVDPLDDFMDGVFSSKGKKCGVVCTRHSRPCKLMTVKRNHKGNKGRKFYVCSMPVGEKCDFFKWEEDTVEATQRALLQSSSDSGFIARQVAATKARFKELTVPELRNEAKKRGLNASGKKDQLLTRLLIWTRDEIADSVEPCSKDSSDHISSREDEGKDESLQADDTEETADSSGDEDSCDLDIVGAPGAGSQSATPTTPKMIDLDDDSSDSYDDESEDGESSADELDTTNDALLPAANKNATKSSRSESTLHESLEQYFGYADFREGQEWAIRRCLSGERTLLVAPTGQGKSLCYALPAALMDGICIVVSPLISLMQDQLRQLPPKIPAATLSGSMTAAQMALIIDDVLRGRYKVLFVSPERLASASFRRLIRPKFNSETRQYERQFPKVSLLCVDEAHCLSQWGHNFRPSYLRVKSLLPLIEPKSVLALTATAGPMVVRDICNTLCIPLNESPSTNSVDVGGVEVLNCNRDNIDVFTLVLQSNDERQFLLHKILKGKKDDGVVHDKKSKNLPIEEGCLSKGNVIIYVWRQKDTEIVTEQLIGAGVSGGVVCYHGGMDANDRSRAQSKFLRGKARICVATVAFGLGVNKPDIDGVIHLCLPPSPEHYLQEIGRAGRDGRQAKAIALPLAEEMLLRHSLAHSDRLAKSQLHTIFSALQKLVNDALEDIPEEAGIDLDADEVHVDGMHIAMPVSQTVNASDCKEESIETILSLLEEDSSMNPSLLSVEGYLPDVATVTLKRRSLDKLKNTDQIAHCIGKCAIRIDEAGGHADQGGTAMDSGFYAYSFGTYQFSVVQCARIMGPQSEPRHVYAALRRLEGNGELELNLASTGRAMHLRMKQKGINLLRTKKSSDFGDNVNIESIIDQFSQQFAEKERVGVGKVESMYDIMHQVSECSDATTKSSCDAADDEEESDSEFDQVIKSSKLVLFQRLVQTYFSSAQAQTVNRKQIMEVIPEFPSDKALLACLSRDISSLLQLQRSDQQHPTGVSVSNPACFDYRDLCFAKILHGIDAPRSPILSWYNHPLWGKYRSYSFGSVVNAVSSACKDL